MSGQGTGVTVTFARDANFDIEAIKRAAYRFSDRVAADITSNTGEHTCVLRGLNPAASERLEGLADEFRNEVLDQDLRIKIAAETEGYRNLVLSLAFSKTPLGQ